MRLYVIALVILLAGLGSATVIYLTAESGSDQVVGYENSKRYMHDLELYGGKANVLANELERWFAGLWQGRSLAFTVAFISIFLASVFFLSARLLITREGFDSGDEEK
ncbi:MAG TPA: hypothetical protein VK435_01375 [Thermodesulfovibrionales bacterium]|nr:hypothetical protein [Thermodesulfovibrionales bacterium]